MTITIFGRQFSINIILISILFLGLIERLSLWEMSPKMTPMGGWKKLTRAEEI
jgi:hypothetical protein